MEICPSFISLFDSLLSGDLTKICAILNEICVEEVQIIDYFLPALTNIIYSGVLSDAIEDIRCILSSSVDNDEIIRLINIPNDVLFDTLNSEKMILLKNPSEFVLNIGNAFDSTSASPIDKFRVVFTSIQQVLCGIHVEVECLEDNYYSSIVCAVLCMGIYKLPCEYIEHGKLCEALLNFEQATNLITQFLCNSPENFDDVLSNLIDNSSNDEESHVKFRRHETILNLVKIVPKNREQILRKLMENHSLASVCISVVCSIEDDSQFVTNLMCILNCDHNSSGSWLANHIHSLIKKQTSSLNEITTLECRFHNCVKNLLDKEEILDEDHIISIGNTVRLSCALKAVLGFKFSDELRTGLLSLITFRVQASKRTVNMIRICVATVLLCPSLINAPGGGSCLEAEKLVIDWIRWMLNENELHKLGGVDELLLLTAIHFHSGHLHNVIDLASTILGLKVNISTKLLSRLRTLFTLDLLPEQLVAQKSTQVSVTSDLNDSSMGFLPVHCVLHLLKHRAFVKHNVHVQEWILSQILNCTLPIHGAMVELLEAYAKSCVHKYSNNQTAVNPPLNENKLKAIFTDSEIFDESKFGLKVLILYYLLTFEDFYQSEAKKFADFGDTKSIEYSEEMWDVIPVKFMVKTVIDLPKEFRAIASSLIKLVACHFPYNMSDNHELSYSLQMFKHQHNKLTITVEQLQNAYENLGKNLGECVDVLHRMELCSLRMKLQLMQTFVKGGLQVLHSQSHATALAFKQVWNSLEIYFPRRLYFLTIAALFDVNEDWNSTPTHKKLMQDPLLCFRVDKRVFRMPPIMECVLSCVQFYLQASQAWLNRELILAPCVAENQAAANGIKAERDELMRALVGANKSAAVQMMLEICLPEEGESAVMSELSEIRCLMCSKLHQMFIADPMLCKVVHFQGYPTSLLSMVVKSVPSIHICIDFIGQMMCQDNTEKRIFGLELLSLLCVEYPIVRAMSCATQAISALSTYLSTQNPTISMSLLYPSIPALSRICATFPPLRKPMHLLLLHALSMCTAIIALQNGGPTLLTKRPRLNSKASLLYARIQDALSTIAVKW